jgi:predicted DNA-binding transcriptional regulator AlpA
VSSEHAPNARPRSPVASLAHLAHEMPCARAAVGRASTAEPTCRAASGPVSPDVTTHSLAPTDQIEWAHDRLVDIGDIREFFKLGRTAAYELTRRPEFPEPVLLSSHCYRWWASEVDSFAASLRRQPRRRCAAGTSRPRAAHSSMPPGRITGRVRPARTRREAC